jgi:ActR/RegA family two-component response regulator
VLCLAVEASASLLQVEDEAHTCSRRSRSLVANGLSVTSAGSSVAARTAATASFAYVVVGMRFADHRLELIQKLRERHARMRIVVVTDVGSFATAILAPRRC